MDTIPAPRSATYRWTITDEATPEAPPLAEGTSTGTVTTWPEFGPWGAACAAAGHAATRVAHAGHGAAWVNRTDNRGPDHWTAEVGTTWTEPGLDIDAHGRQVPEQHRRVLQRLAVRVVPVAA